jgi:hypothetical protein
MDNKYVRIYTVHGKLTSRDEGVIIVAACFKNMLSNIVFTAVTTLVTRCFKTFAFLPFR